MLIIFSGNEKTGKSTLVNYLYLVKKEYFKYRSTHQKDRKTDLEAAISHDWRFFLDIASQVDFNLIFDRSFICQYVYSMLFRKENILKHFNSIKEYQDLFESYCKILQKIPHKIFYCNRKNYINIEDDYIDLKYYKEINKKYNEFFKLFGKYLSITILKFEDGIEYNLNKIKKEIR